VKAPNHASSRDQTRAQLVEVAAHLLATQGPDAVTTRAVALAAGVQAPTIYRLFGDKNGLLDAVAEHGFASYLARKPPVGADADPVESLHAGWELHVGFGLANPELFRLMYTTLRTPQARAFAATGTGILQARVRRVAEAGRLRAALSDLTALTAAERTLLGDWLERIADSQHGPGISSLPPKDSGTVDE
jgi:AcrR family transcriptional regulator